MSVGLSDALGIMVGLLLRGLVLEAYIEARSRPRVPARAKRRMLR